MNDEINLSMLKVLENEIRDTLERDGYMMRIDILSAFNDKRKLYLGLPQDFDYVFTIKDAKISSLPKPHIARDFSCQTELEFHFPSGDVIQTMNARGFA